MGEQGKDGADEKKPIPAEAGWPASARTRFVAGLAWLGGKAGDAWRHAVAFAKAKWDLASPLVQRGREAFEKLRDGRNSLRRRFPRTWRASETIILIGVGVLCAVAIWRWLGWPWLVGDFIDAYQRLLGLSKGTNTASAEALRHFITTVGAILGGAIALGFIIWRQVLLHRQTVVAERQRELSEQTHYTTLFTKAVEQLGATREEKEKNVVTGAKNKKTADSETVRTVPNIEVRLGAIYALERIARENLDFHWQIMEILCAYIRENGRKPEPIPDDVRAALAKGYGRSKEVDALVKSWEEGLRPPRADVQAALTVIGRRSERQRAQEGKGQRLDLRGAGLSKADLSGLHFDLGLFNGAHLEGASLERAHFEDASLDDVHLEGARLRGVHLEGAQLFRAHLEGAQLFYAHLEGAWLHGARLEGAWLDRAHLEGAWLVEAHLEGAAFRRAHVEGAGLADAVGLSQKQVDGMLGDDATTLPDGLTRPARWTVAEPDS